MTTPHKEIKTRLEAQAHAKINLALSVGPPDPSNHNYHPIAGVFASLDLADTIEVSTANTTTFEARWDEAAPMPSTLDWPYHQDLCVKAHSLLEQAAGRKLPTHISLTKRIPVGGGLGGGSADAAATLQLLTKLHGLDGIQLEPIARSLGSDVPFFLDAVPGPPRPAVVTGFGQEIERLENRLAGSILLLFPPFGCSTADVYRAFDAAPEVLDEPRIRQVAARWEPRSSKPLFNDLTNAAFQVRPELKHLRDTLQSDLGQPIHMTGSGSTLFALLGESDTLEQLHTAAVRAGIASARTHLI